MYLFSGSQFVFISISKETFTIFIISFQLIMTVLLSFCLLTPSTSGDDVIYRQFFTDVTLRCSPSETTSNNKTAFNSSSHISTKLKNIAWITPLGQLLNNASVADKNLAINGTENTLSLIIKRIDEVDFGTYSCVCVWSDYKVTVSRYVIRRQKISYTTNIIIGVIAAGVVLLLIVLSYALWRFCCSERVRRKRRLTDDLAQGADRFSTEFYDNVGFEHYSKKSERQ